MANEKRLIEYYDAAYQISKLKMDAFRNVDKARCAAYQKALDILREAPTVDAVEVVHAYWTGSRFNPTTDEYEEYCSHCCAWSSEYGKPYCPNCGAKMDGDRNG